MPNLLIYLFFMVGTEGFEPSTTSTPFKFLTISYIVKWIQKSLFSPVFTTNSKYYTIQKSSKNIIPAHKNWYQIGVKDYYEILR